MRVRGNSPVRTPRVDPALLVASLGSTPTDETALTREDDYEDVLLTSWDIFAHIPARASLNQIWAHVHVRFYRTAVVEWM